MVLSQGGKPPVECDQADVERRTDERYAAPSYLRVVDTAGGEVLGEIEDISLGGFKLQVRQTLQRGATCALRIDIRIDGHDRTPIEVVARNIWVQKFSFDGITRAGFVFIGLSPTARAQFEGFFAELRRVV